jgi:tetratricopeptide (TPR) repeat protein
VEGVLDLPLRPLTTADVTSMVASVAKSPVDEDVVARVVEAADGIPLFVQEMLKMVDDALAADGSGAPQDAVGGDNDRITVPPTLRSLLTERLDRLPHLRDLIDVAAVVGRDVSRDLLDGIVGQTSGDLDAALAALVAHDVLRPSGAASSRYDFSHALLQEAAYESVLRKRRQTLHRRVADVLTERFPARVEREPEVVAQHLVSGGDPASSVPRWLAAGLLALDRAAFLEAVRHFERGIAAIEADDVVDDFMRSEFFSHLGASLQAGRGYAAPGVDDAYAVARSACLRTGRRDRLVSVIRGQWLFHLLRAEYATAFDLAGEMLTLAGGEDEPEGLAEGLLLRGMVHMYRGDLEPARDDLEKAIDRYRQPARSDQVYEAQGDTGVMALAYLAPVLYNLGHVDRSLERSDECLALADRVGGPVTRAQAWGMRTLLLLGRGDPELADWAERTRAHSVERNITYWRNLSELTVGWLRGRAGEPDAGIAQMETALANYLDSGARLGLPLFRSWLADLRLRSGDKGRALEELSEGEAFMAETGELYTACRLLLAKGRVLMIGGDLDAVGASEAFTAALDEARRQRARILELRAASYLTEHQDAVGQPRTELSALIELCAWFGPQSDLAEVKAAQKILGRTHADR